MEVYQPKEPGWGSIPALLFRASLERILFCFEEYKLCFSKCHLVFDFLEVGVGFFW